MPDLVALPMMLHYYAHRLKHDWWTDRLMKLFFAQQEQQQVRLRVSVYHRVPLYQVPQVPWLVHSTPENTAPPTNFQAGFLDNTENATAEGCVYGTIPMRPFQSNPARCVCSRRFGENRLGNSAPGWCVILHLVCKLHLEYELLHKYLVR